MDYKWTNYQLYRVLSGLSINPCLQDDVDVRSQCNTEKYG